jgi:hypothetical protein
VQAAEHERRRLVVAADWAVTRARRAAAADEWAVVLVRDVQHEAADQFGMEVTPEAAAAVLVERLELRAGWLDVRTDAYSG